MRLTFGVSLDRSALQTGLIAAALWSAVLGSRPVSSADLGSKQLYVARDASGAVATFRPGQPVIAVTNPFFRSLGTNGRKCYTCHRPGAGWTITPERAQELFDKSNGDAPLFAPVDAATCPTADVSSPSAMLQAYSLLLNKGLIRVPMAIPANPQFSVVGVDDPYGCTTLQSPTKGTLSVYRRPLPATNLRFLSSIMWDGRELNLKSQAKDATIFHEQPMSPPNDMQLNQIVTFDSSTFDAQLADDAAGPLDAAGASGGPVALSRQSPSSGSINPLNPMAPSSSRPVFTIFAAWQNLPSSGDRAGARRAIAHGEQIFNAKPMAISGVAGLNDATGRATIQGTCGTCHSTPNVGNDTTGRLTNIGVADGSRRTPDLPLFTLQCATGPLTGKTFEVTDPGRALVTGKCVDIGKFKVPGLRAFASRPPYFHDGSAATAREVVEFHDDRFGMGLTDQEKADLVSFLEAL